MNAPCLGQFCCQVLAFVCFFVVTFNIDAKLFCLYVSGGFHLLAHRKRGWLAKLLGKSFKHFPTPLYSNGNNHITPIFIQHYISTPLFLSLIDTGATQLIHKSRTAQPVHPMHSHVLLALMLIFNIFNSIIIYILRSNNSAGGVAGFFRFNRYPQEGAVKQALSA